MGIDADRGKRELAHIRLGDDHASRGAQPPHDCGIGRSGRRIGENPRTRARRLAFDIEEILDREDRAIQRTERNTCTRSCVGRIGRGTRRLRVESETSTPAFAFRIGDAHKRLFQAIARRPRHDGLCLGNSERLQRRERTSSRRAR